MVNKYPLQDLSRWSKREHQELDLILNNPIVRKEIAAIKSRHGITDKKTKELQNNLYKTEKQYGPNIKAGSPAEKLHDTAAWNWMNYYRGLNTELTHFKELTGLTHVPDMFLTSYILLGKKNIFMNPVQPHSLRVKHSKTRSRNRLFIQLHKGSTIRILKIAGAEAAAWKKHIFTPIRFNKDKTQRVKTLPIPNGKTLPHGTGFKIFKRKTCIDVEIFNHTPISAIQKIWKDIEALQKKLPGINQFRMKKQFERDTAASILKHKGESLKTIAETLSAYSDPAHVGTSLHRRKNRIKPI